MRLLDIHRADALASLPAADDGSACPPLAPETFALWPPDVHLALVQSDADEGERLAARGSLWWTDAPKPEGDRLGLVGHYAAATDDAGCALLDEAMRRLRRAGCTRAAGPMDGATWRPYRFVISGRGDEPPFFMEPHAPPAYARHFRQAGCAPWVRYRSAAVPLSTNSERDDCPEHDGRIRALRMDRFERELDHLYRLATASFAENVLYTPMPEAAFKTQYRALQRRIDPDLVRIAEDAGGRPVGFCFAAPNGRRDGSEDGKTGDTVVLKTLAVHPSAREQGWGARLVADGHRVARAKGYRRVIHALMREGNASNRISDAYPEARTLRRYALFAQPLS
jgi:GNAT superfamily N-acetyltransferase